MRLLLLFASLTLTHCQQYKKVEGLRERKNLLGPFIVANRTQCQLACDCARGDGEEDCAQFSGVVEPMECLIYYYTTSFCSFLGDFTVNTCMLPIMEYHLQVEETTPSPTPDTFEFHGANLPNAMTCDLNTCVCPLGMYPIAYTKDYFVSSLRLRWSDGLGWFAEELQNRKNYILIGKKAIPSVSCKTLSPWFKQANCEMPAVVNGTYGDSEILCGRGLNSASYRDGTTFLLATDATVLKCDAAQGFSLNNKRVEIETVHCN